MEWASQLDAVILTPKLSKSSCLFLVIPPLTTFTRCPVSDSSQRLGRAKIVGPRHPRALDVLAAAMAEAGRNEDAIDIARRAIELASAQGRATLVDDVRRRLAMYEANQPYRQ